MVKGLSLLGLVGLQEFTDALGGALADDLLLFQTLDAHVVIIDRREHHFMSLLGSIRSVSEIATVEYNKVLEGVVAPSTDLRL